jgi:hypothetical protein
VTVTLEGAPRDGVTIRVRNPLPHRTPTLAAAIPGTGSGLIGLGERAALAGGRLDHGPRPDGVFLLSAWLPWAS